MCSRHRRSLRRGFGRASNSPEQDSDIGEIVDALPDGFRLKVRFAALDRFSEYAGIFRYPGERRPAIPSVGEAKTWIEGVEVLKVEFERRLASRIADD
jgi:hypothetical protein